MATEADIYSALTEIFHDVFMRDDIMLIAGADRQGVQGWDSFKQIEIIMASEEKWGIKFNTRELDGLRCVGDLATVVQEDGLIIQPLQRSAASGRDMPSNALRLTVPKRGPAHPSSKCPIARSGRRSSQMILVIASSGTARIAPVMPHIQYQKINARITATGLMVNRRASSIGVAISPSMMWMPRYRPTGSSAHQVTPSDRMPAIRKTTIPTIGPRIGTKFTTKATAPHSTGLATPHSHIMQPVAKPTSALMQVTVSR